tara:strand:+ start:168 stop:344 length:177 start_codon:yes stop_codon:yes gene_type:complete
MKKKGWDIGKSHTNSIPGESKHPEVRNGLIHQFIQFLKGNIKEIIVLKTNVTKNILSK